MIGPGLNFEPEDLELSPFKLLEEAELFCQRHLPLPGKIIPERLQRVDKPLIPPDALREILVNALIHRGYTVTPQVAPQVTPQVTPQVAAILKAAREPRSREELQQITGLKDRGHFRTSYLEPLLSAGWLAMTIPEKPNSRLQRDRTTPAGLEALMRETD